MIRQTADWLSLDSDGGLSRFLNRLGFSYKNGRVEMYSPDPAYKDKRDYIAKLRSEVAKDDRTVLLYQDEMTYYRTPTVSRVYQDEGQAQMAFSHRPADNKRSRVCGVLEPETGEVFWKQSGRFGIEQLVPFYEEVVDNWPRADTIYIVQDNWPPHFHVGVFEHLAAQKWPYTFRTPSSWPDSEPAARTEGPLPIQLVGLPTYSPWLNPIEKLWRWLKQDILHMHRLTDCWNTLKARVARFINNFRARSPELLKYCGLLPDQ